MPPRPAQQITDSIKRLEYASPRVVRALEKNAEWGGIAYGSGGSGIGKSSGISDPTGRIGAACADLELRDHFAHQHAEMTERLHRIELDSAWLEKAIDRTQTLAADVARPDPGCWPCSQVTDPLTHRPHEASFQAIYVRRVPAGEEYGAKVPYCSFHAEFIDRYGVDPAADINLFHLEHPGQRIPYQLIRDHHPEQFSLAQSRQRGKLLGRANLDLKEPA